MPEMRRGVAAPGRRISIVTPTLDRPSEVRALLGNLAQQTVPPYEIVLVDAAPPAMRDTERVVRELAPGLPFAIRYINEGGGTAIQRNVGIDHASGDFIAFIDDDMQMEPDFFERVLEAFAADADGRVAAVAGYIVNQYLDPSRSPRWRWYRRLGLFTTYEPGKYDFQTGYPINRYMQPPHDGLREIDFMGTNCAVWRRRPFDEGLRLSPFFIGYGVVEDAHLALQARSRGWTILECGRARCVHNHSPRTRASQRVVARKTAVNYRFLFVDIVPRRSLVQELRFWRVQLVDLVRYAAHAARHGGKAEWSGVLGKLEGLVAALRVRPGALTPP
jgi:GT2 family glycosyltransferase